MLSRNDISVFINCPFDADYRARYMPALLFAVYYCSRLPVSALDEHETRERLPKITDLMRSTRLGLHDISPALAGKQAGYLRYNTAFELGLHHGANLFNPTKAIVRRLKVVSATDIKTARIFSDFDSFDVDVYDGDRSELVRLIVTWLHQVDAEIDYGSRIERSVRSPLMVSRQFERFCNDITGELGFPADVLFRQMAYHETIDAISSWMRELEKSGEYTVVL